MDTVSLRKEGAFMKKVIVFLAMSLIVTILTACAGQSSTAKEAANSNAKEAVSSNAKEDTSVVKTQQATPNVTNRKLKMTVEGQEISIVLYDTPTDNALYEAFPMTLSFSDYNSTEKNAYPPEKLPTKGEPDATDPDVGDLCYFSPWGNLCIFYKDFGNSPGLIKLGRVESGMEILSGMKGDFTATIEKVE